jgi:epoxyqueuosine reductase QueG
VDENFVFNGLQVYGKNGIVLAMELQWDQIKTAPGYKCGMEAFRVYQALGDIVLQMTAFLQERGYKAEAHVPFGGKMLYPPHAVSAGLGVVGRLGLILTPEFGPRQRFGMITTDADLPQDRPERDLSKVEHACEKCKACAMNCPAALLESVECVPGSGIITRIDRDTCEDQIVNNNYCSVCLKVCPPGRPKKG